MHINHRGYSRGITRLTFAAWVFVHSLINIPILMALHHSNVSNGASWWGLRGLNPVECSKYAANLAHAQMWSLYWLNEVDGGAYKMKRDVRVCQCEGALHPLWTGWLSRSVYQGNTPYFPNLSHCIYSALQPATWREPSSPPPLCLHHQTTHQACPLALPARLPVFPLLSVCPVCLSICPSRHLSVSADGRSLCLSCACLKLKIFTAAELAAFSTGGLRVRTQQVDGGLDARMSVCVCVCTRRWCKPDRVTVCGELVKAGNASPRCVEPLDWSIIILGTHPCLFSLSVSLFCVYSASS